LELVFSLLDDNVAAKRRAEGGTPTGGTVDDVDFFSFVRAIYKR